MNTSNSQTATVSTTAAQLTWPQFFAAIVVTNLGSVPVWVATDGSTGVAGAAGVDVVLPGQATAFANRSIPPDITLPSWPGSTTVSLVTASGTAQVNVSPQ